MRARLLSSRFTALWAEDSVLRRYLLKTSEFRLQSLVGPDLRGRRPFSSFKKEPSLLCCWRSWSS